MSFILLRAVSAALSLLALNAAGPKSHHVDRSVPVQVTISQNGRLETFETKPGKIKIDGETFKVWRNTLIVCDRDVKKGKCHVAD